ncbi:cadherin-23-like [Mytilus trossulus]|uniref:cadherin-23-like n=1 Tax=Mytilus trossulus TaxID=6551 RepID=UPI003003B52B
MTLMAIEQLKSNETNPGPSNSTTPVVITIIDLDDNLPEFSQSLYNVTVFENLVGAPLTIKDDKINVTDVDQDEHSLLQLKLKYANGSIVQEIKPVPDKVQGSGNIMLYLQEDFSFDFEKLHDISYTLVASEENAPLKKTECTIHLTILDRNDNSPQFTNSSFVVQIPENSTNAQLVLSETATDKDSGKFGEITYSLRGGGDIFIVNNVTGIITKEENNQTLDYEKRDEYVLTLVAKDGGGSLQPAEVIVRLTDINDNHPVFSQSSYIGSVIENNTPFDITVSASDRDKKDTNNSRVEFDLIDSPFHMQNNFTISTTKGSEEFLGKISLKGSLDYEKLNKTAAGRIKLYVLAKDFGSPSLSSTCTVTINVQDKNDNTPVFNPSDYQENIFENAKFGDYVGNVTATDADGTEANKVLSYYIITGSGLFRIDGQYGVITVNLNAEFDRETTAVYNLTIVAVDRGTPPQTGHTNVTVVIDDVNDTPPKFDQVIFVAAVLENTTVGSSVKICPATDEDLNYHLLYKIVNLTITKDDNRKVENWFRINNATGEVTINSNLDRELTDEVKITLTVEDMNAATLLQTATATLIVSLLDVNDNKPFFPVNYNVSITEGKISGPVITVTAMDLDENPKITYRITKNYLTDTFSIDHKTGQISRNNLRDVDRETTPFFDIEVEANDTVFTNTTKVFITVLDVNDNSPIFRLKNFNYNITENNGTDQENIYNNTCIVWFNASDLDEGPNAKLTYTLTNDFDSKFEIDSSTDVSLNSAMVKDLE